MAWRQDVACGSWINIGMSQIARSRFSSLPWVVNFSELSVRADVHQLRLVPDLTRQTLINVLGI